MIRPQWTLPDHIFAAVTTVQEPGNVAAHVGADPAEVIRHRRRLAQQLQLPTAPRFLHQQHTTKVVHFNEASAAIADAVYGNEAGQVCAILTADCLPILMCSDDGQEFAAVHAGWRGLANGVVENTLTHFQAKPAAIKVWIGPAISVAAFEVGEDVKNVFAAANLVDLQTFRPHISNKWLANLPLLAERVLKRQGVQHITQSQYCTFSDPRFYSYRREPKCGRIASLIWKNYNSPS